MNNNKPVSVNIQSASKSKVNAIFNTYKQGRVKAKLSYVNRGKLASEYPHAYIWYDSRKKPISGILYKKTPFGMKIGASFTLDGRHYKAHVLPFYANLLKSENKHYYAEVSNALEHLLSKEKHIHKVRIDNVNTIKHILNKTNVKMHDDGWYNRYIKVAGARHRKRMYGNPNIGNSSSSNNSQNIYMR